MNVKTKWWKLPADRPLRVRREFEQARAQLHRVRADASGELSQWEIEMDHLHPGVELRPSAREIEKAQRSYEMRRAAWEAAGKPNHEGKRTVPIAQARSSDLAK